MSLRYKNRRELDSNIQDWTKDHEAYQLMDTLQQAGVPAGVVQSGDDLANKDPQIRDREFLFAFDELHGEVGQTFGDKLPIKFEKTPARATFGQGLSEKITKAYLGIGLTCRQKK